MPNIGQSSAIETVIQISIIILPFFLYFQQLVVMLLQEMPLSQLNKLEE